MEQDTAIKLFEERKIRTHFDEQTEEWYFVSGAWRRAGFRKGSDGS